MLPCTLHAPYLGGGLDMYAHTYICVKFTETPSQSVSTFPLTAGAESTGSGSTVQAGQRSRGSKERLEGSPPQALDQKERDSGDGGEARGEGGSGGSQEEGSGSYDGENSVFMH